MSNARIVEILDGLISDQPEQNKAIKSLAPLTVVSAGAGTGKTQTLSQRVAYLLASDETCEIEQILVLTFTEKAAREMQDRIKKTICEWHKDNQRELASLKKAIDHIDDACISTLHSFAMKVIRESGLNLDLDPSAQIAPAPMEDVWWKTFADALGTMSCGALKRLFDAESDDGMKWIKRIDDLFEEEALSELVSAYDPNTLSEAAKTASEKLGSLGKTAEYLFDEDMSKDGSPLLTDVKSYQAKIPEIWGLWWDEIFALPDICEELYKDKAAAFNIRLREILLD